MSTESEQHPPPSRVDPEALGSFDFNRGKNHCDSPYPVDSDDYWKWHVGFYAAADARIAKGNFHQWDRL